MANELLIASIGAGAAIVGGLVTGFYGWFVDRLARPKLQLDFQDGRANKIETTYESNGQLVTETYIRARLRNSGLRAARDCRVFLVGLKEVRNTNTHATTFHDAMVLAWPGWPKDFDSRVIPNGIETYIDIVSVIKGQVGWNFHVKKLYASHSALKSFNGTYRLTLLATADNADPARLTIDVYYDQNYDSLRASVPR